MENYNAFLPYQTATPRETTWTPQRRLPHQSKEEREMYSSERRNMNFFSTASTDMKSTATESVPSKVCIVLKLISGLLRVHEYIPWEITNANMTRECRGYGRGKERLSKKTFLKNGINEDDRFFPLARPLLRRKNIAKGADERRRAQNYSAFFFFRTFLLSTLLCTMRPASDLTTPFDHFVQG